MNCFSETTNIKFYANQLFICFQIIIVFSYYTLYMISLRRILPGGYATGVK